MGNVEHLNESHVRRGIGKKRIRLHVEDRLHGHVRGAMTERIAPLVRLLISHVQRVIRMEGLVLWENRKMHLCPKCVEVHNPGPVFEDIRGINVSHVLRQQLRVVGR